MDSPQRQIRRKRNICFHEETACHVFGNHELGLIETKFVLPSVGVVWGDLAAVGFFIKAVVSLKQMFCIIEICVFAQDSSSAYAEFVFWQK